MFSNINRWQSPHETGCKVQMKHEVKLVLKQVIPAIYLIMVIAAYTLHGKLAVQITY